MVSTPSEIPARLTLCVGNRLFTALPVHLSGQEAALVVEPAPRGARAVRLRLDWEAGGMTELSASVREGANDDHLTHLDLHAVTGDWRPFLAWLGRRASA